GGVPMIWNNCAIFSTNCAIACGTRAYCCEDFCVDVAQRKTNKMASKITTSSKADIRFFSSVSTPQLHQAFLEHFLESHYESEGDSSGSVVCSSIFPDKFS
ncbi:hypothetical protein ACROYT_G012962, partial [Oculina patagonica]